MPNNDTEQRINTKRLTALIQPSWLSGLIAISAGLFLTAGVITAFSLNGSGVQQALLNFQTAPATQPVLTLPGQAAPNSNHNSLQNTWPLLAFWGGIGFIVYLLVDLVIKLFSLVAEFNEQLNYVHAKRNIIIKTTLEYLVFRLLVVAVWLIFIDLFFKRIIPYSITAAHASASDTKSPVAILDSLLSISAIALSLHLHTIFLRLSLRRPRVFSSTDYLDIQKD